MRKSNKGLKFAPEVYDPDEMERLLRTTSLRAPTGIRNRALLVMGYRAGLRCAEALALKPKDVDFKTGAIRILEGKGRKPRTVGIDNGALAVVQRWIDKRKELGFMGRQRLFCKQRLQMTIEAFALRRIDLTPHIGFKIEANPGADFTRVIVIL